ncbi:response regulator [Cytobacillus sp. FJAT-53684]|uniref:histidine kinase n=1 Tax=Cytobacillus mangrovibacter TaxID=3299024 RepID=A0ABW6K2Z2_9BACI
MKIRIKLFMLLTTLPILIFILIGISWFQLNSLQDMSEKTQSNYDLSFIASKIHREVKNESISLRTIALLDKKEDINQGLSLLAQQSETVRQNIALIETKVNTEKHKKITEDLRTTNQKFNVYKDEVAQLLSEGKKGEAIELITTDGTAIQDEFLKVITVLTDMFESNMNSSMQTSLKEFRQQIIIGSILSLISLLIIISLLSKSVWSVAKRLNKVSSVMNSVANGNADLNTKVEVLSNDEIDEVAASFNQMVESLNEQTKKEQDLTWIKSNIADITTGLSGMHDLENLSRTFLTKIVPLTDSSHAVFYLKDGGNEGTEPIYKLLASYAFKERKHLSNTFIAGEGLVGQAVLEKSPIILTDVPGDYIRVKSGLGEAPPLNIYVLPILFEDDVKAVLEIASFKPFSTKQQAFIEEMLSGLGIIIDSIISRNQLAELLEESQMLMEEVQSQSEELQSQQEELRMTNEELEEQTNFLRQSEEKLQKQQEELEQANNELREKALRLEERNKLIEMTNKEMEKTQAELEEKATQLALSSKYKSEFLANMSHELRTPLNSLLLLSKLLADNHSGNLTDKQVEFSQTIYSSGNDLLALINDILDLAKIESGKMDINISKIYMKDIAAFVESTFRPIANEKQLTFNIKVSDDESHFINSDELRLQQVLKNLLSNAFKFTLKGAVTFEIDRVVINKQPMFSFSITDTGVGIPKEKQELIFQAFQQADGTTSRKFGGTGLGLSICREIAARLGGEITVNSKEKKGSTFTFYLGDYQGIEVGKLIDEVAVTTEIIECEAALASDKGSLIPSERSITESIETKSDIKNLLIVDDNKIQRNSLMEFIGDRNVIIKAVSTGKEAIEELKIGQYDCIVLDLGLADTSGFELLEKIKSKPEYDNVRVFIYTGREISSKEEIFLNKYAHSIIIKDVHSPQRLKEELSLYLNSSHDSTDVDQFEMEKIKIDPSLEGKRILLVDDDVRNVYALSSVLELLGLNITFAENGVECLDILEQNSNFDLVLMDIMMPEMNGYEAIRKLRAMPDFIDLPVIALTAKAMKEDREKCIEAGASDYIVKPIDLNQLISLIRVWLYPQGKARYKR